MATTKEAATVAATQEAATVAIAKETSAVAAAKEVAGANKKRCKLSGVGGGGVRSGAMVDVVWKWWGIA